MLLERVAQHGEGVRNNSERIGDMQQTDDVRRTIIYRPVPEDVTYM